jgi:hypothetical protein
MGWNTRLKREAVRAAAPLTCIEVPEDRGRVLKSRKPETDPVYIRRRDKRHAPVTGESSLRRLKIKAHTRRDTASTKRDWYELYIICRDDGRGYDTERAGHKLATFNEWLELEGMELGRKLKL